MNYFVLCNQSNLNVNADSSLMVERDNSSIEIISAGAICGVAILSVVMVVAMVLGCHLKTRKSMIFISQCLIVVNWNFWTALEITFFLLQWSYQLYSHAALKFIQCKLTCISEIYRMKY